LNACNRVIGRIVFSLKGFNIIAGGETTGIGYPVPVRGCIFRTFDSMI